ncbi:hypothetical protein HID58_056392 [Brassica napus]|uniref:Enoyl reductase (ER) domain-containing protein n=3 Tax=Brassica TaxID=3705 RepID=A0ABQ8AP54_BRANA|nr:hypothetical protein HID58_056392 [Brassica napus]
MTLFSYCLSIMGEVLKKEAYGLAVKDESGVISPFHFSRRETGENDVRFKVLFCGICHTDLSMAINEWGFTSYPLVPGHEIVGVVTEVGAKVTKFNAGDKVGVGYMVSSCGSCETCTDDQENYCPKMILTSGGKYYDDTITYGGYSDHMVCEEDYIIRIPENLPLDATAPLLCAGTTVYSPMKYHGLDKPGMHIGVVGLGGLGHVAVKFAKAMGIKVTVISTSDRKRDEALTRLGADLFLVSRDPEQMKDAMGTMDGIIDTVSATHPVLPILDLLKYKGKLIMVGAPDKPLELPGKKMVVGSMVGGIKETQEMMDLAGKHNITADIELISADYVNTAMERLQKADVRYRFVIDVANTLKPREKDVRFKVLFCGICHSDLHMIKNEWGISTYPLVPGHEIVGVVTEVGSKVTRFKTGDKVGVGCLVGSCGSCDSCTEGLENYCPKSIQTYGFKYYDDTITYGGYSDNMVCDEGFIIRMPDNLPLDAAAPLLCAGITVYSPLKYHGLDKPGMHIGVVGLGGLGHVAVKFAKAMGLKVTVISTSDSKRDEAINRLGADAFVIKDAMRTLDGIINTVSATHSLLPLLGLLKPKGKLVMVGAPEKPLELPVMPLIFERKMVMGSMIGGIKETQEMVDMAGKHNITADIELISADYVNTAMERLEKADVRYRFVIDVANTLKPTP